MYILLKDSNAQRLPQMPNDYPEKCTLLSNVKRLSLGLSTSISALVINFKYLLINSKTSDPENLREHLFQAFQGKIKPPIDKRLFINRWFYYLVETRGIEPLTSWMPFRKRVSYYIFLRSLPCQKPSKDKLFAVSCIHKLPFHISLSYCFSSCLQ